MDAKEELEKNMKAVVEDNDKSAKKNKEDKA